LFSLVLGHSRYLWARFCLHQDLQTLLRLHIEAFEHLGGVPREILYDRMKTAVLGEGEDEHIVYNRSLLAPAAHYGFSPRACKPYRAKTKGKVERPYRYIRQEAANALLPRFIEHYNARFSKAPRCPHDAHRRLEMSAEQLLWITSEQHTRTLCPAGIAAAST